MAAVKKGIPHIIMLAFVLTILVPFAWVLMSSLKTNLEITNSPWALPRHWLFSNYTETWKNAKIGRYFFNSLYISGITSMAAIFISAMAAFAVTRMRFGKLGQSVNQAILVGLVIPGGSLLIPLYILITKMHIYNTPFALLFPYITFSLPVSFYIISAFMKSIPGEMEEAGVVEGLGAVGIFFRIILPLTLPALVTVFILNFLGSWNEFIMANFYISSDSLRTLPVGMVQFRNAFNTDYSEFSAGIVFSILPVIILYAFLQEKIIEGVTAGSVKG